MIPSSLFYTLLAQTKPATDQNSDPKDSAPAKDLSTRFAELFGPTFSDTTFWGWLLFVFGIILGIAAGRIARTTLNSFGERLKKRGWAIRGALFQHASGPTSLALLGLGFTIGLPRVVMSQNLNDAVVKFVGFIYIVAIAWFLYNLIDLIDLTLRRVTSGTATRIDDTVVTLLRKILRVFLMVMFVLFVAENFFGADITAWLAGLGIAGLAVSLAAQDSIKNLFGSITVMISRPFGLGDHIVFGTYNGIVENISFRDTKIRTLGGHLVTVPNMKFSDGTVENITARPFVARTVNLGLAYDTPPAKIEEAVSLIKGILAEAEIAQPINLPDRPPRVFFNEFMADGLNIMVNYHYAIKAPGNDWWTYQAHAESLNLKVLQALTTADIEIAFRTQTVYLAGDRNRELAVRVLQDDRA